MAIVGSAFVTVRVITRGIQRDIQRSMDGMDKVGRRAGKDASKGFRRGLKDGGGIQIFGETFFANNRQALKAFRNLSAAQNVLFTAIPAVLGAIGSLGSGLLVLVGVLSQAATGGIVLANALGGLAQAAVTAKLAFTGVGEALSALNDSQNQSISNTRAQEAATRRLRDARLALKKLIEEEKPEALAEAREAAVRAEEASADAQINSEKALRTYNDAQQETIDAIDDLNDARDEAREKLQQLRFELEGGAISEKRARLEFEKARDSLQRVQDLPPNSRARQEAELAFAEAELNLRKAIDNNADLKKEEEAATRAGVEGSQEVVAAKERIADAQQAEVDAGRNAARAARDAGRAQTEAAEAAAAAAAGGSVEKEINERIARGREQVRLAEQALGDAASAGINQYAEAIKDLSPTQIAFVEFLNDQRDAVIGLRQAAAEDLFPRLETALTIIIGKFDELEPIFQETGRILGDLAIDFAETFFQGENFERLKSIFGDNNELLEKLGTAVINLLEGFVILLSNATPLIEAFGDWAVNTSEAWKNTQLLKEQNGELATEFERVETVIGRLSGILGNYKTAFGDIFDVINQPGGAGDQLLTYFEDASSSFKDFISEGKADGSLNEFFTNSTDNFTKILDLLANLGGGILNLGASPGVGQFIDSLDNVVTIFNDLGLRLAEKDGPIAGLGEFLEEFARLLDLLTESGALDAFFDTLTNVTDFINDVLESEVAQSFIKAFAPLAGILTAIGLIAVSLAFASTVATTFGSLIFTGLLQPIGNAFKFVFDKVKELFTSKKGVPGASGALRTGAGVALKTFLKFIPVIGLVVGILLEVIPIIIRNWDKIKEFFTNLFDNIKAGFDAVAQFFKDAITAVTDFFRPAIDIIVAIFTTGFDIMRAIVDIFVAIFKIAFVLIATVVQAVWDGIKAGFKAVADFLKPAVDAIFGFFKIIFNKVKDAVLFVWGKIEEGFQAFIDFISPAIESIFGFFEDVFGKVKGFFKDTMNTLIGFAEGFINFFIDGLNFIIEKINGLTIPIPPLARPFFDGETELGFNIRPVSRISIPRLAEGGIVKPTAGGVLSLIGEAGKSERIEPLDSDGLSKRDKAIIDRLSGGRGTTINVYPSAGMDENDLARLVSQKLASQLRRGAA